MFHLNKQKIISIVICLLLSAIEVFACFCGGRTETEKTLEDIVKYKVKNSTMVFTGKVIGFEYRKDISHGISKLMPTDYETKVVKFQVKQWWKGEAPREIFLVTQEMRIADGSIIESSCNYRFKEDESYLVFAYGKENELGTNNCSVMQPLNKDDEYLKILGEGKEPLVKKDEPNNLRDASDTAILLMSQKRPFLKQSNASWK
ncbi:MAG TPA: hypothetical protein VF556_16735 [Pyrinomonadaceae bacterium]|jgi:hypothetical protein